MPLLPFLKLVRYPNLLMIAVTQVLVKYFLFEPLDLDLALDGIQFSLLVISMISLAGAGNIINDLYDQRADAINKPQDRIIGKSISQKTAYFWYFFLTLLGIGIGTYLSVYVGNPSLVVLYILPAAFLYLYATQIKGTVLVGNLVVSVMVAMIIVMVGIFDLIPAVTPENKYLQHAFFSVLVEYGLFAFLINFLREMVKDQEDIRGDYNAGYKTLPVLLGRNRTNHLIFFIALLPLAGVVHYIYTNLFDNRLALYYATLFILAPLVFFIIKITEAEKKKDYHLLSLLLKFVLTTGVLSIGLYRFILI